MIEILIKWIVFFQIVACTSLILNILILLYLITQERKEIEKIKKLKNELKGE